MQAKPSWSPPTGPLGRLSAAAGERADALLPRRAELEALAATAGARPSFAAALRRADVAVIAELKRRSPSKGVIDATLDAGAQTAAYARGGASALSVLTEPGEFGGTPDDVRAAREATSLPVLKKDFHVHPIQLLEAVGLGASAVLLIARAVTPSQLHRLAMEATSLGLEVLVEVRAEHELDLALEIDYAVIGVNSRNLETLEIDPTVTDRLIAAVPPDRVAVAESGVSSRADVERAAAAGADAVLVGSVVSASPDPAAAVAGLVGVTRRQRAR
ncbi:MAG TPA: indole-3-glycerol-phosphate synthase [Gemmatimonadaceae bacterium]|nr:indole-3-glycerol-phosphate synthase [Gemmatimonadaceae bacterium]